jgi:hypothetical protein
MAPVIPFSGKVKNQDWHPYQLCFRHLNYYREDAATTPVSLNDVMQHAVSIYGPRCQAARIKLPPSLTSKQKIVVAVVRSCRSYQISSPIRFEVH